ncbi:MAG: hypothetical protein AMXMBFR64_51760 [Myxococcales bacterium]
MRKGVIVGLVLLGLLLGVGTGVYLGLPTLAERFAGRVIGKIATHFGRELRVGALRFHRWDRFELEDVVVRRPGAPDSEPPLFASPHIDVRFDPESAIGGKVRLLRVEITSPSVGLVRYADGTDSYGDVVERVRRLLARERTGQGDGDGPFKHLARAVPEIVVKGATATVRDHTGKLPLGVEAVELTDGSFTARDLSKVTDEIRLVFSGHIAVPLIDNAIGFEGHYNHPDKTYDLAVALDRRLQYVVGGRDVSAGGLSWDMSGRLQLTDVQLAAAPGSPEAKAGKPALRVKAVDLTLADPAPGEVSTGARGLKGAVGKMVRRIRKVTLIEPELYLARYADKRTSFSDLAEQLVAAPVVGTAVKPEDEGREQRIKKRETERSSARERREKVPGEGFRLVVSGVLGSLEGGFRRLSDAVFMVGSRMPIPEIAIQGGTLHYKDALLFTGDHQLDLRNFDMTAKRLPGEPVLAFDVRFETGGKARSSNQLAGRIHLQTRDVQVGVTLDRLPLLPYRALFPKALPIEEGTVLHKTRVQFVYSHERDEMQVEGSVRLEDLGFAHRLVASEPLTGLDLGADFTASMDFAKSALKVEKSTVLIGGVRMSATGTVQSYDTYPNVDVAVRMPRTPVQVIADSLPTELVPMLEGLKASGYLSWSLDAKLDTKNIATMDYTSDYRLEDFFVVDLGRRLSFDLLRGPFIHRVHEPDGTIREFMTGPGAPGWVPYGRIAPEMTLVITTTEDGSFFSHSGFSTTQMKQSLITNIQKGGFYRGASTISQQLVKNLFLSREKTMSRKLQELFITWQMEKALTKEEILALYFNVIEFGPGIYGIGAAARHYFGKSADELSLLDCVFLASIIPNPKKYYKQFEGGQVTESWRQKLEYYARKMVERGKISEYDFAMARPFSPVFAGQPTPPRPAQLIGSKGQVLDPDPHGERPGVFDPDNDEPGDDPDGEPDDEGRRDEPPVIEFAPAPRVMPTKPPLQPRLPGGP